MVLLDYSYNLKKALFVADRGTIWKGYVASALVESIQVVRNLLPFQDSNKGKNCLLCLFFEIER